MWDRGAWPSSLGWEIVSLNVASGFMQGADAAYVKAGTDRIIEEAMLAQKSAHHLERPSRAALAESLAMGDRATMVPRRERTGRHRLQELASEARLSKRAAFARIADQAMSLTRGAGR